MYEIAAETCGLVEQWTYATTSLFRTMSQQASLPSVCDVRVTIVAGA